MSQPSPGTPSAPLKHDPILDQARQVIDAISAVPAEEQIPTILISRARLTLRDVADRLQQINTDYHAQMAACRDARDLITALLYDRGRGLVNVETIAADAGVTETSARRAAKRVGMSQRRPRHHGSGPPGDDKRTVEDVPEADPAAPNVARMYDYLLGGTSNFAADRAQIELARATNPEIFLIAQQNRAFLGRAVRLLTRAGIRQFLDIGTGIPAQGNVHEVAQEIDPGARVVYVDNDPVVLTYGHALLSGNPLTDMIEGDLRNPEPILNHPQTRALIDFGKPVAVLLLAVLHWVKDNDAAHAVVARLREAMAPGSTLVISHVIDTGAFANARRTTPGAIIPEHRTVGDIARFFDGLDMLEPGLVPVTTWRPDTPRIAETTDADTVWLVSGIGRKP